MTTTALPLKAASAARLFSDLAGRAVEEQVVTARSLDAAISMVRGVYAVEGRVAVVMLLDVELAAALAAALVVAPAAMVRESVVEGRLSPMLHDAVHEVLNIANRLVNRPEGEHYLLVAQFLPGEASSPEAAALIESPEARADLRLAVAGFGTGMLTVVAG